jgi:Calcineurin-like phosphoesterase
VPGNHDVTWNNINDNLEAELKARLTSEEAVNAYLLNQEETLNRKVALMRLENYFDFTHQSKVIGQPDLNHDYFYTATFDHRGTKIGIAGLNSALFCTKHPAGQNSSDLGHLAVGEPQLRTARKELEDADFKVALMHHPPSSNWFQDFDATLQFDYLLGFDFILSGHEHRQLVTHISHIGNSESSIQVSSGALYVGGKHPSKRFKAVRVNLNTSMVEFFFWIYSADYKHWVKDVSPYWSDGRAEILGPLSMRKRLSAALRDPQSGRAAPTTSPLH